MTAMSFDQCNPVKWRQNEILNCLAILAIDVNEDWEMFSQEVNDEGEHVLRGKCS